MLGRFDKSIEFLNKLIDIDPYNTGAWYSLGITYTKMADYPNAIDSFEYCLAIDEDFIAARFNKANALVELERFEDAIGEYLITIERDGPDSITYCNLAGCLERMERNDEAREYYRKAAKINPNIAEAWFGIGLTFDKEGSIKDALQYIKRAAVLEPDNTEYLLALAEVEYKMGNVDAAIECYKEIIVLDPLMPEAWLDWTYVLYVENRQDEAIAVLEEAISLEPENHLFNYRMVCYLYANGKIKQAKEHLVSALSINFDDHYLMFEILPVLQQIPDIMEIIELHRK